MKSRTLSVLTAAGALAFGMQASAVDLDDEEQQISYSIGVNIGQNLEMQGLTRDIDIDVFIEGLRDAIEDNVQLSEEQMMTALSSFQQRLMEEQETLSDLSRQQGEDFLRENAERDGVETTDSGLQYMVLESGDGSGASPSPVDAVLAHYEGRFIDGEVFDSSIERGQPVEFRLNQVIPGWTEGLQLMQPGDRYRLFIPSALGYGPGGSGPIPPHATLIFDVELLEVNP